MARIWSMDVGRFWLDGGAVFGIVPRVMWERVMPPDAANRVAIPERLMLIEDGARLILVDTGLGTHWDEWFVERYRSEAVEVSAALAAIGHNAAAVTDVVLTHLHFDHAGGLVTRAGDGLAATLPGARLWVQRRQWEWAQRPSMVDRASYLRPYMDYLTACGQVELLDGPGRFSEAVEVFCFDGHTVGQQSVLVQTDDGPVFFGADLLPTAPHLNPVWNLALDHQPLLAAQEKADLLERACAEDWRIFFEHDAEHVMGRVRREGQRYVLA